MSFKDYFSTQSVDYRKFRPDYPQEMINFIVSKCTEKDIAWDCATGNGQVATMLSSPFKKVIATDASSKQIEAAEAKPNIEYRVATAEDSKIESNSIDLITVAQAAHWFNLDLFYKEVMRVAKPNAILAVWGYANHSISVDIDNVVLKLYKDILHDYWPAERATVEQGYKAIQLPFKPIEMPVFSMAKQINLHELIGYLSTWSATQLYMQRNHNNPISLIYDELLYTWGDANEIREIRWPVFLRIAAIN
jgi:ubiquinone/menaquinone biosynthesis C-methylase UbiE